MEHSFISPSSASAWIKCPAYVTIGKDYTEKFSGFAHEGQVAHSLAEQCLTNHVLDIHDMVGKEIDGITVDNEMVTAVDTYIDDIYKDINRVVGPDEKVGFWKLLVEQRADLSWLHPDMFGTFDAAFIHYTNKALFVYDLKYGKGLPVSAERNPQLVLYALGLLGEKNKKHIKAINFAIIQPRIHNSNSWCCDDYVLYDYADKVLYPAIEKIKQGSTETNPGEHCRFCKVLHKCKSYSVKVYEDAKQEAFNDISLPDYSDLSADEVAKVLDFIKLLTPWADGIKEHAANLAVKGETIPGYKLVKANTRRRWKDEAIAIQALQDYQKDLHDYQEVFNLPKLKTPLQIEKLLSSSAVKGLWEKPEGRPVIADIKDKRKEYNPIKEF